MTEHHSRVNNPHLLMRICLIVKSLGVLGSLSFLGTGMAWGNTNTFVDNLTPTPTAIPSAPRLSKPAKAKVTPPPARVSRPAPRPAPPPPRVAKPARNTTPVARPPAAKPTPRPAARPAPQPVARPKPARPTRTVTRPAPRRPQPAARPTQPAAPRVAIPPSKPTRTEIPQHLIDRPHTASARETNNFIDSTNYNTGNTPPTTTATTPTTTPSSSRPTVVMRNRSTGCEAVMQNGRLSSGSCNVKPKQPRAIARQAPPPRRVARRQNISAPRVSISPKSRWQGASVPVASRRIRVVPPPAEWAARVAASAPAKPQRKYHVETEIINPPQNAYPNNNNTGLLFPLPNPARISSDYGWRVHPIFGNWRMHSGTDIAAPTGTPVIASYHGEVAIAEYVGGYGKMVALRHEDGTQESRYAHLSEILVEPGEWVEQGQVIGLVGSTGNSTGPHLHFEWRHLMTTGWIPVDAGPHLEWAMTEMLDLLDSEEWDAIAEIEEIEEPELYTSSAEELGEMVLGLGSLFEEESDRPSDRPVEEEVSPISENLPPEGSQESEATIPTYIKPGEFAENRVQLRRSN
ncbi:MAG: peptidoglycan DD-metalloendopeptidase family protein [Cyanobacteria bacterium SBLK]|nr:peptidoglycan DD-metalloendopeptidase family protein [Cyanobacteria bacterium SBLK]